MPHQIYIGNNAKGLQTDRTAFNIDNDAFAKLFNFYVFRGRVLRKRGTESLDRLQRQVVIAATPETWEYAPFNLTGDEGNLFTGIGVDTSEPGAAVVPGTINLVVDGVTYTDPGMDGTLSGGTGGSINYATGDFVINGAAGDAVEGTFSYYPSLPVMGLEDFVSNSANSNFPFLLAFDTVYAYQVNQSTQTFYTVNYYKETGNPVYWSGDDYQQFWTTNYQAAFWATNGKPGLHALAIVTITVGAVTTFTTAAPNPLVTGDLVWFNEITGADAEQLNGSTFDVTVVNSTTFTIALNTTGDVINNSGIFQLLTTSIPGQDGIRWYDGDPTNGTGIPVGNGLGWVNFSPPLSALPFGINNQTPEVYYLVGAIAMLPFKDRLLFFAPSIQAVGGPVITMPMEDTVIWSWNGTPYYSEPVPETPTNTETFDITAWYVDQTGKGGYLPAGISQPLLTVNNNEDVLLIGFGGTGRKTRFVYTGNDLQPFLFYSINSELPSASTFSSITLDRGGLDIGAYGLTLTTQQSCQRVDLDIPDEVFTIQAANNGNARVNAVRDFFREWIYFSYPIGSGDPLQGSYVFPTRTLMYNYRENVWSILKENYTHHGTYRIDEGYTWDNIPIETWDSWDETWDSGGYSAKFPSIIAGTPQGYVQILDRGLDESPSGYIQNITASGDGNTIITSVDHCVELNDYLYFTDSIGNTFLNGLIGKVIVSSASNTFTIDIPFEAGTYLGLGQFSRLCKPSLQTKQFPVFWKEGRSVRLMDQKYLLDRTDQGEITAQIFLSQDPETEYNSGPITPEEDVINEALIYTNRVFTCPESTNLGLTPYQVNLQQPIAARQSQIWHRMSTSLIGNTFQIGITLDDRQMRDLTLATAEIALHGIQINCDRAGYLA